MVTTVLSSTTNAMYQTTGMEAVLVRSGVYRISQVNDAVRLNHSHSTLTVVGEVYGADDSVQVGSGADWVSINVSPSGVIGALESFSGDRQGIDIAAGVFATSIQNAGTISGRAGIDGSQASTIEIHNTGEIKGAAAAVTMQGWLYNSGMISSTGNYAVMLEAASTVINTGDLLGRSGISGSDGADTIVNSGTITGSVRLGDGRDSFDGRGGTVVGHVSGQGGSDTYIIDNAGLDIVETAGGGTDRVLASVDYQLGKHLENLTLIGAGNISAAGNELKNTIKGNSGNNQISGESRSDTLLGKAGNDVLYGGKGNDTLKGGGGSDHLFGSLGNDVLFGDDGRDELYGGRGADDLRGGDGADVLIGGLGQDTLRGGDGTDTFRFVRAGQSPSSGQRDKITDFTSGEDAIDLKDLTSIRLDVAIGGSFSGQGPSLRTLVKGGTTRVLIDTDGDRNADMRIYLAKVTSIDQGDFIL